MYPAYCWASEFNRVEEAVVLPNSQIIIIRIHFVVYKDGHFYI